MRKILFVSLLIAGAIGVARADSDDHPGPDWISLSQVNHELTDKGFTDVTEIEADDGLWKAHAVKDGVAYKVKLDPHDGHIVQQYRHHED